jgi:hypothetical protein
VTTLKIGFDLTRQVLGMTELVFLKLRHDFLFARSVQVNGQETDDNKYENHADNNNDGVSVHKIGTHTIFSKIGTHTIFSSPRSGQGKPWPLVLSPVEGLGWRVERFTSF